MRRAACLLLASLHSFAAAGERPSLTVAPEPELGRLSRVESVSAAAAARPGFEPGRAGAQAAFEGADPVSDAPRGRMGPAGRGDARLPRAQQPPSVGSGRPVPGVHAAKEDGVYKAEPPPHMAWDWDGTAKTAAVAFGAALIGFAVGGPIGAAVAFVAGFFVAAIAWRIGAL